MGSTDRIMDYIEEFMELHGFAPTVREIQAGLEISSTSVVNYHLKKLEADGSITREPNKARSIVMKVAV